jgi:hypothetical protein
MTMSFLDMRSLFLSSTARFGNSATKVGFIVLPLYGNQNGPFRGGFRSKPTFGLAAEMWYCERCAARKRLFFEKWQQLVWPCKA